MASRSLSIVIPCYNEEQRIPSFQKEWTKFLTQFEAVLAVGFSNIEIVFVNDGSKDETLFMLQQAIRSLQRKSDSLRVSAMVASLPANMGKGAAVRKGLSLAEGDSILMTDVDLSTPLPELFKLLEAEVDLAFGSRALVESKILRPQSGLRPFLGRIFNRFLQVITGIPFHDTQCGFKLIEGQLARALSKSMTEDRFAFDIELLLLANQMGASFEEIPVEWMHQEPSRVSPLKDGIKMAIKVVKFGIKYPRWQASLEKKTSPEKKRPSIGDVSSSSYRSAQL